MARTIYSVCIGINTYGTLGSTDPLCICNTTTFTVDEKESLVDTIIGATMVTNVIRTSEDSSERQNDDNDTAAAFTLYTWGNSLPLCTKDTSSDNRSIVTIKKLPFLRRAACGILPLNPLLLIASPDISLRVPPSSNMFLSINPVSLPPLSEPVPLTQVYVTHLTTGVTHCLAKDNEGNIYTWGTNNALGQLGRETNPVYDNDHSLSSNIQPTRIPNFGPSSTGGPVISISSGWNHNGIITSNYQLYLWGDDSHGQCNGLSSTVTPSTMSRTMTGSTTDSSSPSSSSSSSSLCVPVPTRVSLMDGVPIQNSSRILPSVPVDTSSFLTTTTTSSSSSSLSFTISDERYGYIRRVSCGAWHTAIITLPGELYTCGEKSHGALGHSLYENGEDGNDDGDCSKNNSATLYPILSLAHGLTIKDIQQYVTSDELLSYSYDRGCLNGIVPEFRKVHVPVDHADTDSGTLSVAGKRWRDGTDNIATVTNDEIIVTDVVCTSRSTIIRTTMHTIYVWGTACLPDKEDRHRLQRFTLVPQRLPLERYLSPHSPSNTSSSHASTSSLPFAIAAGREHYVIHCCPPNSVLY